MTDYTEFLDPAKEAQPPGKGILSRTRSKDDRLKVVAFGFAHGEDDTVEAKPGTWGHMAKGLRRSIQARTPVVRLLPLVK